MVKEDNLFFWKEKPAEKTFGREKPPLGNVSLRGIKTVEPALLSYKENVFKIISDEGSFFFQADTEENMMKWIAGLFQEVSTH